MNGAHLATLWLQLRLAVARAPLLCGAALLALAGAAALAWLAPQGKQEAERHRQAMRLALQPPAVIKSAPVTANDNLVLFYSTLGEQRYAEQQVKTLFALAGKAGLALSQGEYKSAWDANARVHTYQVTLPVKGNYRQIWQFGLMALRDIPFASLDEISFKREAIGDANIEARLRLTLYLAERPGGALR